MNDVDLGLPAERVDVLVVGGGIVGAGVARDAALRGLKVVLVEQGDFASGTSSRSSRLLHGGLRYLAQGHVRMVYEASREKAGLGHIAPHLCQPLAFLFPTRAHTPWNRRKLALGVRIYDWMTRDRRFARSESLEPAMVLARLPLLAREGLTGAVRYYDALTQDARLVLDTLRSAAAAGAVLRNYCRLTGAEREGDGWAAEVVSERGARGTVRARTVVNATGAWAGGLPHSRAHLRPTKGVHLVVPRVRLPVPDAVVMGEGSRILFAIPWGERTILGTTDTDYTGPLESPMVTAADVDEVLGVVQRHFPAAGITRADIRATWAGLRPLVAKRDGSPSDISRAHEIREEEPGWIDVTGGKLTTYRLMAEQTVTVVGRRLGGQLPPCRTAKLPLVKDIRFSGILPPEPSEEAVAWFCREEWAVHLDDVMVRRAAWHTYRDDREAVSERVLTWMAKALGWDSARCAGEAERYARLLPLFVELPLAASQGVSGR